MNGPIKHADAPATAKGAVMSDTRLAFIRQQAGLYPSIMAQMALECAEEIARSRVRSSEQPDATCKQSLHVDDPATTEHERAAVAELLKHWEATGPDTTDGITTTLLVRALLSRFRAHTPGTPTTQQEEA